MLKQMVKENIVSDVDVDLSKVNLSEFNKCELCMLAKHHKLPYRLNMHSRNAHPLFLIHTDFCGVLIESFC